MWKLLPLFLLIINSCASEYSASSGNQQSNNRIVKQVDLPLNVSSQNNNKQPLKKGFQGGGMEGWLKETGEWRIKGIVEHTRLLCGTYEIGIQLGTGNQSCLDVAWLTNVEYGTRQLHCNSATRIHTGGGEFRQLAGIPEQPSCVRVVVRCAGVC